MQAPHHERVKTQGIFMPCAGFIAVSCCHQRTDAPKLRNRQRSISIELNVCIVSGVWCEIWRFSIDDIVAQKYGTNRIKIAYPCALITKSRMFDKMLKCSLDGKSPVNGLQEKGKYIFIRTPSKEDSYKHLSTNMREHNNHLLSEEHNEDRLGRRDSQVIQESTDRSIILCALFLVLGVLAFSSAICICCKTSKDGNFKRQSLKHLAHIRRRFDSTRLRTPLHSALPSRSFTLFENDQMEPVFLNKLTNNDNCKTSNVTPVQEEIPLETRIAVRIDIDEKRNPVPGCSGISAAPVLRTDQTGNSQPRPQWTLSAEEKQRKLQDRERRIRLRNSLFDRVLSEEDQFEVYVVNEQQL